MKNPKICMTLVALIAMGCTNLTPAQQARVDKFNCQVSALKPALGDVLDVEALVRDLYAGKADISTALGSVGATQAEVQKIVKDLAVCNGPQLPAGAPS
jgi:hypothetical protein